MEREKTINISPVCRFGPGGDYIFNWPLEWPNPTEHSKNILLRLLDTFVATFVAPRGGATEYSINGPDEITGSQPAYAETLFADDLAVNKTAHRMRSMPYGIRTYKPIVRKKPCLSSPGQATLFDAELKNAKTA